MFDRVRGFTLLELMIVIIIVGVLATLGVMQYQAAIEKSRGAEARQILGQLRSQCAGYYMEDSNGSDCTAGNLRIIAHLLQKFGKGQQFRLRLMKSRRHNLYQARHALRVKLKGVNIADDVPKPQEFI